MASLFPKHGQGQRREDTVMLIVTIKHSMVEKHGDKLQQISVDKVAVGHKVFFFFLAKLKKSGRDGLM